MSKDEKREKADTYHHGDLKESLIKAGLKLLVEEGPENFSLRKVAAICNVSHAAPYKHFKNKEELINSISIFVSNKFFKSLKEIEEKDPKDKIVELGKRYVSFMVENYDCLKYLFFNSSSKPIFIENNKFKSNEIESFNVFLDCAKGYLKSQNIKEEEYMQDIVAMWAMVHGLATMIANNTFKYDGDYLKLVEDILRNNLKF